MEYPKVLLGGPVSDHHDYCYEEFLKAVKSLTYPNLDILFVDNSKNEDFYNKIKKDLPTTRIEYNENVKVRLVESRNLAREKVLKEGYDYLFCLDQDVIPPNNIIEMLIELNKEITSGVYYNEFTKYNPTTKTIEKRKLPIAWVLNREGNALVPIREDIMNSGKVIKVRTIGTGCILIHRNVLEKIKFRYQNDKDGMDDVFFCTDAVNLGYEIFVDTKIKCEHLYEKRPMNWGEGDLKY